LSEFNNYNNTNFYGNQNFQFEPNKAKNTKGPLFIVSIILFVLGFLIYCFNTFIQINKNSSTNLQDNITFSCGYILGAIFLAVVLFLLATKVFKKHGVLLAFSIVYLLCSFGVTVTTIESSINEAKANRAGEEKLISICNNIANQQAINEENYDKSQYGELTPILNLIKDYGTQSINLTTSINNDISSMGFEDMLSLDTLGSTEKINNVKKKIEDSSKIYDKFETDYNDLITNFDSSVVNLELPKSFKSGFLDGFRKSQDENRDNMKEFMQVERDLLSKINNTMDLLLSAQGKHVIQNNQILFYNTTALNQYNGYIGDIRKLAQKEADVQKKINDSKTQKLGDLNKLK
jgi:uncharacterized protein YfkK (UPF0435 family)